MPDGLPKDYFVSNSAHWLGVPDIRVESAKSAVQMICAVVRRQPVGLAVKRKGTAGDISRAAADSGTGPAGRITYSARDHGVASACHIIGFANDNGQLG